MIPLRPFLLAIAAFCSTSLAAHAQVITYYPPMPVVPTPVVTAAPVTSYSISTAPAPVTTYAVPTTTTFVPAPVTTYSIAAAPVIAPAPVTTYSIPAAPVTTYSVPTVPVAAPVTIYRPATIGTNIYGQPRIYIPGQPVRNALRALSP